MLLELNSAGRASGHCDLHPRRTWQRRPLGTFLVDPGHRNSLFLSSSPLFNVPIGILILSRRPGFKKVTRHQIRNIFFGQLLSRCPLKAKTPGALVQLPTTARTTVSFRFPGGGAVMRAFRHWSLPQCSIVGGTGHSKLAGLWSSCRQTVCRCSTKMAVPRHKGVNIESLYAFPTDGLGAPDPGRP